MHSNHDEVVATNELVDLPAVALIDAALARNEGMLAENYALAVYTGTRTGRSPQDRFIVKEATTEQDIDWGVVNKPFTADKFKALWTLANNYLHDKAQFISHLQVGADPKHYLNVKVITELAWHNLFAQNLFIKPYHDISQRVEWTLLNVPGFKTNPERDGSNSDATLLINFAEKKILLCGLLYAGEMKKAMFTVMNYLLPRSEILPMHCAANMGPAGDVALFFGLSGTGKTTLSADPERLLIGDDEHGWGENGVFNFEGGCYAKCINLSASSEPLIWDAIRYGTVMENVVLDESTKHPDYSNTHYTQNTRAAYPRDFIVQRVMSNRGGQPKSIIFLSCDLYGVLPPVALLTKEQAAYYFLSGYTALVGSTEVGQGSAIKPTFSTCFGAPFFPRPANVYADLLIKRLETSGARVYLVNTGWTGGAHGAGGERFAIPTTRRIISAIVNGDLENAVTTILPRFNFKIPTELAGVDSKILDPRQSWQQPEQYESYVTTLVTQLQENFKRFQVAEIIRQAGPI